MAAPTYTAPPNDPPVLGDPNFAANAQGYLGWFPTMGTYCEAFAAWLESLGVGVEAATIGNCGVTDNSILPGDYEYNTGGGSSGGPTNVTLGSLRHNRRSTGGGETQLLIVEASSVTLDVGAIYTRERTTGAWSSWRRGVNLANVVGTVSQSSGTPTGAIVERGSNANGEYVRWADGTQICTATVTLSFSVASACSAVWTFPAAFIAAPAIDLTLGSVASATPAETELAATRCSTSSTTQATLRQPRIFGMTDFVSGDVVIVTVTAVGRWF